MLPPIVQDALLSIDEGQVRLDADLRVGMAEMNHSSQNGNAMASGRLLLTRPEQFRSSGNWTIGHTRLRSNMPGRSQGAVHILDGQDNLAGVPCLLVGYAQSSGSGLATADGELVFEGGQFVSLGVNDFEGVGVIDSFNAGPTQAEGKVTFRDAQVQMRRLNLGYHRSTGVQDPQSYARGEVTLVDSDMLLESLEVATCLNDARNAEGTLRLIRSRVEALEAILHPGSRLWMEIHGDRPGLDCSVLCAATAQVGGQLKVTFALPPRSPGVWDLIVLDTAGSGTGDFELAEVQGLPEQAQWSLGWNIDSYDRQVYRLEVTTVPEPGCLLLLLVGALAQRRKGRRGRSGVGISKGFRSSTTGPVR